MIGFFKNNDKNSTVKTGDLWEKKYKKTNAVELKAKDAMNLEHECLRRLDNDFCICGRGPHFPRIISANWRSKKIVLTDCGETICKLRENHEMTQDILPEMNGQVTCILENLNRCSIKHLDIHRNNICIKNGVLSLIDFDIAILDDNPLNSEIKKREKYANDLNLIMKRMIMI